MEDPFCLIPVDDIVNTYERDINRWGAALVGRSAYGSQTRMSAASTGCCGLPPGSLLLMARGRSACGLHGLNSDSGGNGSACGDAGVDASIRAALAAA